jgi:hypothetical protein
MSCGRPAQFLENAGHGAEFEAERIYHRVHGGRNTAGREGWGSFVGLARIYCVGELWELLDRI